MASTSQKNALAQSVVVGLESTAPTQAELDMVSRHGLGGVILFARNIKSPRQVWQLNRDLHRAAQAAGRPPLLVMVDQEGGSVARLGEPFTHGPDLAEVGASWDLAQVRGHGARMGAELIAAGFNWNLAPVLDVHAIHDGIMARRSLGSDPSLVAKLGAVYIEGLHQSGCLACAKHFPGLGRTTADTHLDRPTVGLSREDLDAVELVPFAAAAQAKVDGIMVCHAVFSALDPQHPASLSAKVIGGLLRGELGYGGLVLSDDLEMGALAADIPADQAMLDAYQAGCDLLLVCKNAELALAGLERLTQAADAGMISEQRIMQSAQRIARIKQTLAPAPPQYAKLQHLLGPAA